MEVEKSFRFRVKVEISTKGVRTWDCSVEGENATMDEVLMKSDTLVSQLESRYPIKIEEVK